VVTFATFSQVVLPISHVLPLRSVVSVSVAGTRNGGLTTYHVTMQSALQGTPLEWVGVYDFPSAPSLHSVESVSPLQELGMVACPRTT
jgi:hypothetical protein